MCLIGEAAFSRNLAEGRRCRQHEPLGPLDATPDEVLVRRLAYIDLKWARASARVALLIDVGGDFRG
jgi:hypothetical protein